MGHAVEVAQEAAASLRAEWHGAAPAVALLGAISVPFAQALHIARQAAAIEASYVA